MGFIEETGAAQFLRDVRVTAIYERHNGQSSAWTLSSRQKLMEAVKRHVLLDRRKSKPDQRPPRSSHKELGRKLSGRPPKDLREHDWLGGRRPT